MHASSPSNSARAIWFDLHMHFGGWSTCHAVQWDISAPPFGDRVVLDNFQKHSYPIGIVVNLDGERFTAGDLMMSSVLRIFTDKDIVTGDPRLATYIERCTARAAFQRALAAQLADFREAA